MARYSRADVRDMRMNLDALSGSDQIREAITVMHKSIDLDLTRHAIGILGKAESPDLRDEFLLKYEWCDAQPLKRDGGGYVRAAIVRALRPISGPDDLPIFLRAMMTYEKDGAHELCADLRAVALLATNDIDPDIAADFAARFLNDATATMSGEPATTAMSLLASHGNLAPIFGVVSWGMGRSDVIGEGLRNLTELPDILLPMIVDQYLDSENELELLGLFELLLGHRTRDQWSETIETWFRTTTVLDLYGIVAIQVVASRSDALITMLRNLRQTESDRVRAPMLDQALDLA